MKGGLNLLHDFGNVKVLIEHVKVNTWNAVGE
jgi:hypothetical protein